MEELTVGFYKRWSIDESGVGRTIGCFTQLGPAFSARLDRRRRCVVCQCKCGRIHVVQLRYFLGGMEFCRKCGSSATKHSRHLRDVRKIWQNMIGRCTNPKDRVYHNYGGRGIKVCDRWLKSFENFYADVGPRPSKKHTLDRYPDQNGNYEPGNVRWATWGQQARNKRTNRLYLYKGEMQTITDIAILEGINRHTLYQRVCVRGWDLQTALQRPVGVKRGRHAVNT